MGIRRSLSIVLTVVIILGTGINSFFYVRQQAIIRDDQAIITQLLSDLSVVKSQVGLLSDSNQSINDAINALKTQDINTNEGIASIDRNVQTIGGEISALSDSVKSLQQSLKNSTPGQFTDFTTATDKVKPSVVVIEVQVVTIIFGRRITQRAEGSGWVINSDGLIVTNSHVVADAVSIKVTLPDGRVFPSISVQTDPSTDLAVVKIDAHNLPAVKTGDSDRLQVGQPVAAIGNALGLGINMTGGWVSRLNTSITFSDGTSLSGLIGTDAAINPGNSGGPLINAAGEVIGITNAKLVETGVEGIGYAISINNAVKTINNLISRL